MIDEWSDLLRQFPWLTQNPVSLIESEPRAQTLLAGLTPRGWRLEQQVPWMYFEPSNADLRQAGWKLHLSGTPQWYSRIVCAVAPILFDNDVYFKVLASQNIHELMLSPHWPRESAGKLVTIYPKDDEQLKFIADACHEVTSSYEGPRILSDFRYKPTSLVHYRYGSFIGRRELSADGNYKSVMSLPNGSLVEDLRRPYPYLPPSVRDPFRSDMTPPTEQLKDKPLLLNDRFEVTRVLRHANKGGVYVAKDTANKQQQVLIKEARPHVAIDESGRDAVDTLKREARILEAFAEVGTLPRLVDRFEDGQHYFIAEEFLEGADLRGFAKRFFTDNGHILPTSELLPLIRQLVCVISKMHAAGMYLNDLNPNNVFIESSGNVRLIDPELARVETERPTPKGGTFGYSAPEVMRGEEPTTKSDVYSLGATTYFLMLFRDPAYATCDKRSVATRQARSLLRHVCGPNRGLRPLASLVLRCLDQDPDLRPTLDQFLATLETLELRPPTLTPSRSSAAIEKRSSSLSVSIANHAVHLASYAQRDFPWPLTPFARDTHPTNLMNGASGILSVLGYLTLDTWSDGAPEVEKAATWLEERIKSTDFKQVGSGLYHGRAGIAWAFHLAGRATGRESWCDLARELLLGCELPKDYFDVTHGLAGLGIAFLWFWKQSGDTVFLAKASEIGQLLGGALEHGPEGAVWSVRPGSNSPMEGLRYYGFAHGTAGIGYFLDQLYLATKDLGFRSLGDRCFETIANTHEVKHGAAYWPFSRTQAAKWVAWCNGSTGIGTYLIARHRVTGDPTALHLAQLAANAAVLSTWRMPTVQCHGIAGNGEFLLDLWKATGNDTFLHEARQFASIIHHAAIYRDGHWVVPDESGVRVSLDFGSGTMGVAAFLARIVNPELPRIFMSELEYGART